LPAWNCARVSTDQTFAPSAVPEPSELALLGLGLAVLGVVKRRRARG